MSLKMLIFDYKDAEKKFFKRHQFHDFDIEFFESSLNETTVGNLPQKIKDTASVISVFITSEITPKILEQFPNLMIISTRSTGYDHIDIDACCNKNIKVLNVENYGANSVVQYTFTLILALVRRLIPALNDSHAFKFDTNNYVGRELNSLTLGIIGTGAIGASVCKIAHAFGMRILAFDYLQRPELTKDYHVEYTEKETLYKEADIITLHVPLTNETQNLISKRELALMKHTAIIINTARGELIESEDLYNALLNKNIAGAGLDVTECEKISLGYGDITEKLENSDKECVSKVIITRRLSQLNNVIITPHVAYNTQDSINKILRVTFDSIKDCLQGGHANQVN